MTRLFSWFKRRPKLGFCQCGHQQCFHADGKYYCGKSGMFTWCNCRKYIAQATESNEDRELFELRRMAKL